VRSPGLAFAWELRQRHRWGLVALAGYLLALGTIKLLILAPAPPVDLERSRSMWLLVLAPLTAAAVYLVAVFSFGLSGDLAARQSIYPTRMFTLPVKTAALAGWPMLYGTMAVAGLWLATALFALRPSGIQVPLLWPALFAAGFLAWTQALLWMPYGLPGTRVIVAVLWLAVADTVVLLAIQLHVAEARMAAFLAPQVPLGYFVAALAVRRARRGDVPDWRGGFARLGRIADLLPRWRLALPSPGRAQLWYEWRRHGQSLPALVAILLPFELAMLFVAGTDNPALFFLTLVGVLLTPPFMASFAAATVRKSSPEAGGSYGVTAFTATRPLTTTALIAAKLKMTIWSTLAAWLLVLVAVPLALTWSDTWPVVIERGRLLAEAIGAPRAIVVALLGLAGLVASTWKQLAQSLYLGLTGREWLVKASGFAALALLCLIGPLVQWVIDSRSVQGALWNALPWIPAVLVCFKMAVAGWLATRLYHSQLIPDRALLAGAAGWTVAVLTLYGVLAWLFSESSFPHYLLLLVAILEIPLVRLSAAPLALAWNRHR